jgi:hypothetical protein
MSQLMRRDSANFNNGFDKAGILGDVIAVEARTLLNELEGQH